MDITQIFGPSGADDDFDAEDGVGQTQASIQSIDDLLDEIDTVLETNAETFVQGFVQKGGQ